jgi:hypothetical protein
MYNTQQVKKYQTELDEKIEILYRQGAFNLFGNPPYFIKTGSSQATNLTKEVANEKDRISERD